MSTYKLLWWISFAVWAISAILLVLPIMWIACGAMWVFWFLMRQESKKKLDKIDESIM